LKENPEYDKELFNKKKKYEQILARFKANGCHLG
jgi:hypothetical protein